MTARLLALLLPFAVAVLIVLDILLLGVRA